MDKKAGALLGAVTGLATMGVAQASSPPVNVPEAMHASSYADLLTPIANPVAVLRADDAARTQIAEGDVRQVQYYYNYGPPPRYYYRHHHHHHHHYYHHHHHHHHHSSAYIGIPGVGGVVVRK